MEKSIQEKIFDNYSSLRGESVDRQNDKEEQRRFNKIVSYNYLPYISPNAKSFLEIGSYKGFTVKALKDTQQFDKIDGIDLSQDAIEFSKKLVGIDTLYVADAFSFLQGKKATYDFIIMKAVLEHIEKKKVLELLQLIKESLTKDGVAIIGVPNMSWISASHERYLDFTHEVGFTPQSLRDVMNLVFSEVDVKPMKDDFIFNFSSALRIIFLKPIATLVLKVLLTCIGQGACPPMWNERGIMAIVKK